MSYNYKECELGTNKPYRELLDGFLPNLADYYENPTKYNIEPFRIYGNLYYVGDKKVCMHLVDTGDGLVLFDTGYSHNYDSLIASVEALGFSPYDIKAVIHSHAHFDHFGGGDRIRKHYGAKIYMSAVDTALTREMPERALMHLAPSKDDEICYPDVLIEDGDVIRIGNTEITCLLAPGHTPGTMAFFFKATDGEKSLDVGYFGGVGFLSLYKEYLQEYRLDPNMLDILKETVRKLSKKQVDIFLGNHPYHNCTLEKRQYMIEHEGENPFINREGWDIFLKALEDRRADFVRLGY